MIYQYRYKKFRTLKAAQNYINTLLMVYTCIDTDSIAIKESETGFIVRLQIESSGWLGNVNDLLELCTLTFNEDNTISVVPHSVEDVTKGKVYPTFSYDPEQTLMKLSVDTDSENTLYPSSVCILNYLLDNGLIIDEYSKRYLDELLYPYAMAWKEYEKELAYEKRKNYISF